MEEGRGWRCALHAEFTVAARNRAMGGCAHCCCAISINRVQGAYRVLGGCLEGAGCRVQGMPVRLLPIHCESCFCLSVNMQRRLHKQLATSRVTMGQGRHIDGLHRTLPTHVHTYIYTSTAWAPMRGLIGFRRRDRSGMCLKMLMLQLLQNASYASNSTESYRRKFMFLYKKDKGSILYICHRDPILNN